MRNVEDTAERRSGAVALPGSTIKLAAALVAALIIGVTSVLWNIVLDFQRLDERVSALMEFGPRTGERFTKDDGERLGEKIDTLRRDLTNHIRQPHHAFAGQRIKALNQNVKTLNNDVRRIEDEVQKMRNGQ